MIGIIGAMEVEVSKLKEALTDRQTKIISNIEFSYGKMYGKDVVVATSGIGKVFASICAEAMILSFNPEIIINTGVAGGLRENLRIADIVISENAVQHDMDTSPLGDPVGLLSGINIVYIPADKDAAALMKECVDECGINNITGTIASGDQFIEKKEKKEFLINTFNASACEMEGASIAHVCYVNNVKFCIIRSISDGLSDEHISYEKFCDIAAENSVAVTKKFIEKY